MIVGSTLTFIDVVIWEKDRHRNVKKLFTAICELLPEPSRDEMEIQCQYLTPYFIGLPD